jgi:Chaperone of endosialidase
MKTPIPQLLILLLTVFFASLQNAHAVSPPPDGGYPGGNTAEGQSALLSRTTGGYNTAVGYFSLLSNTTGSFNTAIGAGTLLANMSDDNTATGAGALLSNSAGSENTANGAFALFTNSMGVYNTATGSRALFSNIGNGNTADGAQALYSNSAGFNNTAVGGGALYSNTMASNNTAIGASALGNNIVGENNTAVGVFALSTSTGAENTAVGLSALGMNTGNNNTALGSGAGDHLTTGDNNIDIGFNVQGVAGESNTIRIGNTDINTTIIRGISGATIASGSPVLVAANGQLGTMTSSARFKEEIKPMDKASEALLALKPVTFRYKKEIDPARIHQFGLVAEEVEKVNPDLVVRDENGRVYSVRYDQVNAMLLNEFLKEHRKVEDLEANAARQQKQVEALTAGLQKVSAQLELSKAAPRTVLNNQ